ncbi:hypothetical protein RhiirA4_484123, partial [Rhizophagus irregularis]
MALSKTQTEALIISFRRIFKNKLKFACSAPNAILDNPYIYGYRDFYDNQLQAKIADFCIQLNNNGLLGKITEIHLKSLQDNNKFLTIKGGRIPLEDVVDNAYYSKHRERLREKNILFLDQIILDDKSRLLLWKEILVKAYVPISSQRKEAKWYTDIRLLITSNGVHLHYNITQLFGAFVANVDETRSYNIDKKNRSLIAFYNSQFNSVVIGKIQEIDDNQQLIVKHFHTNMSLCTDTHTYIYQCMDYGCAANAALSMRSPCTFSVNWRYLVPLLTESQFASIQPTNLIDFNIFDIFDFAKKKYNIIQRALTQSHVISLQLQDNIILDLLDPSISRNDLLGELLAVLLALIVVSKNSKVRINTDSLNVITQFEKLKKSKFSQTSHEYFKANNNFLLSILCRIIITLNLHVEMFKVTAHSDDVGNNYVDDLAKKAHLNQDRYIVFRHDASMMKVIPCWNGILIENKLRSFLKNICNYRGLERFINLNRNYKYRQLEVDWTSTFICLNCDINNINNNETSVSSSKTKAQKVHLLIEEIPTIEQMKKSLLNLYDEWMCPICGLHDETFNHVWTCSGHYTIINNIRDKTINHLLTWVLKYNDNIQNFNNLMALDIWDISYDPNNFTFIDLIKGIISISLSELLNSWTTKKNVVEVLIQMR